MSKEIKVSELQYTLVKCPFCKKDVELGVFPLHQHLCKKTLEDKNKSENPNDQQNSISRASFDDP